MIQSISFKTNRNSFRRFHWRKELPFFDNLIEFKKGLNVIVGPTGTGKSTLLDMVVSYMAAKQGGVSTVTEQWVRDNISNNNLISDALELKHDGQPVLYSSPHSAVGISGSQLDDDFFLSGLLNVTDTGSSGQKSISKTSRCVSAIAEAATDYKPQSDTYDVAFPDSIEYRIKAEDVNDVWQAYLSTASILLEPKIKKSQKTIIMDEPDASLSLLFQRGFWQNIIKQAVAADFQIIVASHSIFALNLDAHYIETVPNYVDDCKNMVRAHYA